MERKIIYMLTFFSNLRTHSLLLPGKFTVRSEQPFPMHQAIVCILFTLTAFSVSQNVRTLQMVRVNDVRYSCNNTGCSPSTTVSQSNLLHCEMACLANTDCRTVSFAQSNKQCVIFVDIPNQFGNMLAQPGVVTSSTIDERRLSARK